MIKLIFDGYWRDEVKSSIPLSSSGIYCVYRATRNAIEKTCTLHELLYIGESANVRGRISTHEKLETWKKKLQNNEVLYYSCAPVSEISRVRAEAALIYKHQPSLNKEFLNSFPFPATDITTEGKNSHLLSSFTVNQKG